MRIAFCSLLLVFCIGATVRADDAPLTVDQLLAKLAEVRKQKADLDKQEAAVAAELRARFKDLYDKLVKLGLIDPSPGPLPPPPPVDPLKQKLSDAFKSATGESAQKSEWAKDLAALYRQAAKLTADPSVTSAGVFKQKLKDASASLIGPDALKEVRQVVAAELVLVLPTTEGDLTADQRTKAAALFNKLADLLDAFGGD